jgi:hypothetical protein
MRNADRRTDSAGDAETRVGSGEPDEAKVSSPVRRGDWGKVPARVTRHFPTLQGVLTQVGQEGAEPGGGVVKATEGVKRTWRGSAEEPSGVWSTEC